MAVITPTWTLLQSGPMGHTGVWTWASMVSGDTAGPVQMGTYADRSIQIFGTVGAGSMALQGSNEGTNDPTALTAFAALHDPQGAAIAMVAAGLEEVAEVCNWVKPVLTGAGATLTVCVFCRSTL